MDEMQRNTLNFCLNFINDNIETTSQNTQCRTWLKEAVSIIKAQSLDAEAMILSELEAVDQYLSGKNSSATSADARTKLDTVRLLCN